MLRCSSVQCGSVVCVDPYPTCRVWRGCLVHSQRETLHAYCMFGVYSAVRVSSARLAVLIKSRGDVGLMHCTTVWQV